MIDIIKGYYMEFYLINGSNRKKYNTAKLLNAAKEGICDELERQDQTANVEPTMNRDLNGEKTCNLNSYSYFSKFNPRFHPKYDDESTEYLL